MLGLYLGDLTEGIRDLGEALLLGDVTELGIEYIPLLVLTLGSCQKVLGRGADDTGGIRCSYGQRAAFEILEETLRMFLLLLGRLPAICS